MATINRIFYSHIHTAIETVLIDYCQGKGVKIEPSSKRKVLENFRSNFKRKISVELYPQVEMFFDENMPD